MARVLWNAKGARHASSGAPMARAWDVRSAEGEGMGPPERRWRGHGSSRAPMARAWDVRSADGEGMG
ncbi:MAG TPA: hypothetical protein PKY01_16810, partial [Candidatus Hydrogenedentes bacterium]|nr:hypothetical protein [Candidatus Hydrogenedentota bacterium]